jgi:hypothetical protein
MTARTSDPPGVLPSCTMIATGLPTALVNVDWQEAALVIIRIEERELLATMDPSSVSSMSSVIAAAGAPTREEQIDHGSHHPGGFGLR